VYNNILWTASLLQSWTFALFLNTYKKIGILDIKMVILIDRSQLKKNDMI